MDQTWDNGKLTNFRSDFCLCSKFGMLDNVASYHFMQFQEILINQIEKMTKKPSFGPDFGQFGPNSGQLILFQKSAFVSH